MWIQVRSMDGRKSVRLDSLSKLTKIEEVRQLLEKEFDATPERQRLFYRGKQLEDGHSLFDYDVGLNDIIQLMVRPELEEADVTCNGQGSSSAGSDASSSVGDKIEEEDAEPIGLYKVGEKVDARDLNMGAWFEAQVVKVTKALALPRADTASCSSSESTEEETVYYHLTFDDYSDEEIAKLTEANVRPRARYIMQWDQLHVDQVVMVNYNSDLPKERGYWYDGIITRKEKEGKKIFCKLVLGTNTDAAQEVRIRFVDEIFRVESKRREGEGGGEGEEEEEGEGETRIKKPDCSYCKDNPRRNCKHCACSVCGGKDSPDKQIICDECDMAFHLWCLSPVLETVPEEDEWYCPECKLDTSEVIGAGEKLRLSKKKSNMVSKKSDCNRDWGKGMACVGRTKVCTIVPSNHFGPIPGVPVGSLWKFRVQASEAGVHRPHVAGIHGRENEGAYSIVLSGGYDDDKDDGDKFVYSGSGGRDLSGNKRTAKQTMDQKLTAMNKALAKNCDAPLDDKKGATAKDWRKGKPVRVVRNHKGRKTSKFAPVEGNRYDGIYKVARYWPAKNDAGFVVWKYLLQRDDPAAASWTTEGKKTIKKLGLTMQYPEGYLDSSQNGKAGPEEEVEETKRGRKRKSTDIGGSGSLLVSPGKAKQPRYELNKHQRALIKADAQNKKIWEEVLASTRVEGTAGLLGRIQDAFLCVVCQEVVFRPITTSCGHNICKSCLQRSFKVDVFTCPNCRHQLGKDYPMDPNTGLQTVLSDLFPGYEAGR